MNAHIRRALLAAVVLPLFSASEAGAVDAAHKVQVDAGTYMYIGGGFSQAPMGGQVTVGICRDKKWFGGSAFGQFPNEGGGEPATGDGPCPATANAAPPTATLPDSSAAGPVLAAVDGLVKMLQEQEAPLPDDAAVPGGSDCTSTSGAVDAVCVEFGEGDYVLGKGPDASANEFGVCLDGKYWFVKGPDDPDGSPGEEPCPQAKSTAPPPPPPPADQDGDGIIDQHDKCPTTRGANSDGCPNPPTAGSEPSESEAAGPEDTNSGSGESQTQPPEFPPPRERSGSDRPPAEQPRVEFTRTQLTVRGGRVTIPLRCEARQAPCRGRIELTTVTRREDGRRRTVSVGSSRFEISAGEYEAVVVRLSRAAKRALADAGRLEATAVASVGDEVERQRIRLHRR